MSDDSTGEDALRRDVHVHFRNAGYVLARLPIYSLLMFLPAQAVAMRRPLFVVTTVAMIISLSSLPWFRILWRELPGFQRYFYLQTGVAVTLAVGRYFTPELWPILIALAINAILVGALVPALRAFCQRFELPGGARPARQRI